MAKSIHSGHRDRLREKFLNNGIDNLEDHEAIELLLYYAIPYKDTNPLAHRLMDDFGSVSAIFDADPFYLKKLGYSNNVISLLKIIPEFFRLYSTDKTENKSKIISTNKLCEYFEPRFLGRTSEVLYLLLMDSKDKEVFSGVISKGSINTTDVPIRKIMELAMSYKARSVAIAHNHPSGLAIPSAQDISTTKMIASALRMVSITLVDHVIVADDDSISLAQSMYSYCFVTDDD